MKSPRTIKVLQVSIASGSDPDVIEALDDCDEAYGDWPDVIEPCIASPTGQCQYDYRDGHENCIHCGKGEGVW